jgi:hypothetical protein
MEQLPLHVESLFLKGQHVTRHIRCIWNGFWSDQFIKSTFGHSAGGIIGITLKTKALKIWTLSCKHLLQSGIRHEGIGVGGIRGYYSTTERRQRQECRKTPRTGLVWKLEVCMDPKKHEDLSDGSLVNIVSGKIAPASVNVDTVLSRLERTYWKSLGSLDLKDFTVPSPKKLRLWRSHANKSRLVNQMCMTGMVSL